MALAMSALASFSVGCKSKPRCPRGELPLPGLLAAAQPALAEGSVCSIYGGHAGSAPHAQVVFWGERDELRRLKLKIRLAMRTQGWDDFDPSSFYYRASEDELNFRQGNQRMKFTLSTSTWRGLVSHSSPAINVDVGAWIEQPRGYR